MEVRLLVYGNGEAITGERLVGQRGCVVLSYWAAPGAARSGFILQGDDSVRWT